MGRGSNLSAAIFILARVGFGGWGRGRGVWLGTYVCRYVYIDIPEWKRTRSARLSSSWPIMLLFFLQRATLPSMKSKNRPKGRNARAA